VAYSPAAVADVWIVSADDKARYESLFASLDSDKDGFLSGMEAATFLAKSQAGKDDLKAIWVLSDQDKDGSLSLPEFSIAMHLVMLLTKLGKKVPDKVPASLLSSVLPTESISTKFETEGPVAYKGVSSPIASSVKESSLIADDALTQQHNKNVNYATDDVSEDASGELRDFVNVAKNVTYSLKSMTGVLSTNGNKISSTLDSLKSDIIELKEQVNNFLFFSESIIINFLVLFYRFHRLLLLLSRKLQKMNLY
jgi:hypothetical protein